MTLTVAFCFALGSRVCAAQTCHLRISVITLGPGSDLYSTFGHSAVRIVDSSGGGDYVFNYGTFNFGDPHFYWKFTRGKLLYFLSAQDFPSFLMTYRVENRKVTEQLLNLTCEEKEMIWQFLQNNYLPQNRSYKYNFLFDNCSTRIRDIFSRVFGPGWKVDSIIPEKGLSFREIINRYLKKSPWERLGINLLFGKRADTAMQNRQIMFLPDYLMKGVGHSHINGKPLVKKTSVLYKPDHVSEQAYPFYLHPLFWFTLFGLAIILLSFGKPNGFKRKIIPWVDRCLFFLTGLLGCFMLFMWFGTDHRICAWNYNLLWAFPFNIVFSFYLHRNSSGVRRYATLVIVLNIILLLGWFVMPQQLPFAVIPVMVALTVRAWRIFSRPAMEY